MPVTEFKLTRAGDVALVTIDNGEDWTKPTFFGREALESLDRLLGRLEGGDFRAAVVTGKPFVFAAGADITEFPEITRERAIEGARAGHELFGRLRALPFPTVAAINGACLGGGVELALHCTARTVSTAVRHFAFPEVFLGLFPAWGGTQLLPRLVGPETAIKVIVSNPLRQNRMLTGPQVAELGIADRLLEPGEFVDESLAFALELAKEPLDRLEPYWSNAETIFRRARTSVDDTVHGAAPAPYAALDLIEGAQHWTIEEGYEREQEAIGELLPGPQAQASLYAFQLVELRAKRHPARPTAPPIKVTKVGIVGAGLMARQVATLFLRRLEVPIVIRDVKQEIVDEALADVRAAETDDVALATVWDVGEKLRKRPILVNDAPGFVVNRVLTRMTRVIMDALEHGTPVEEVDQAVMSLGMPMAPSVLLQMVGPRVANHVLERMHDAFPERFLLSPALAAMADGGEPVVLEDAPRTGEQIVEEVLEAVADEIHLLLEEGVVAEAADVDTGLLLGAGWPFFLGRITKHLDQIGMSERLFGHTFADLTAVAPA